MGLLNFLKKAFSIKNQGETTTPDTSYLNNLKLQDDTHSAMNLSGVFACVDIISNSISKLPFFVIDNITKKHIDNKNIYNLLNIMPTNYMTATVFKKIMARNLLMYGNAYAIPVWNGINLKMIIPLENSKVQVSVDKSKLIPKIVYVVTIDGKEYLFRYDEIIHIKIHSIDGITGNSPLTYARLTTEVGLNQEEYQKSFYKNGGRPSGTLEVAGDLSSKKVEVGKDENGKPITKSLKQIMSEEWEAAYSGSKNSYRTPVLDNGVSYKTIEQISPSDMDFVNSKTVNLEDIARFFNIPAYKLGVGKQTYSNNEQGQIDYVTNCLVPLVMQFEQEFSTKLQTVFDFDKGYLIKANLEVELRGDTAAQSAWLEKMLQNGIYNRNTCRKYLDMPETEDDYGNTYFIGPNYTPIESIMQGQTAGDVTPNPISNPDDGNKNKDDGEGKENDNNEGDGKE